MRKHVPLAVCLLLSCGAAAAGQSSPPDEHKPAKIEVGIHFSALDFGLQDPRFSRSANRMSESGVGMRAGYNLTKHVALEGEINFFPNENAVAFDRGGNLTQGQFGVKVGKRFDKFGLFAKGRPGFLNFSQVLTQTGTQTVTFGGQTFTFPIFEIRRRNFFSFDVGGVVEFYPSRRVLVRFDVGDTMVHEGEIPGPLVGIVPQSGGLEHKFQFSSGIAFRFLDPEPSDEAGVSQPSSGERKFEVGAQFSSLGVRIFDYSLNPATPNTPIFFGTRTQFGLGGRFTYNFLRSVAAEVQTDFYPGKTDAFAGRSAGGRILQVQAGAKVGKRFEKWGLFGKVRPGAVSFSETFLFDGFSSNPPFHIGRRTYFSLDAGGVLEFYPSPRIVARFDGGDTMIRYGGAELGIFFIPAVNSPPAPFEFHHNFQFSAGVGFRF
jgi:outer membrane protein with beta-barrel domain